MKLYELRLNKYTYIIDDNKDKTASIAFPSRTAATIISNICVTYPYLYYLCYEHA